MADETACWAPWLASFVNKTELKGCTDYSAGEEMAGTLKKAVEKYLRVSEFLRK
jgi:hypothetical protein